VPSNESPNQKQFYHWLLYKTNFKTPKTCTENLCSLIFGEIGDAAEFYVNGKLVGISGKFPPMPQYSKNYPSKIDVSSAILNRRNVENRLMVLVYSMKIPQSGIRSNPVGIMSHFDADTYVKSKISFTILLPLFSALILILLG